MYRILVVEDDFSMAQVLQQELPLAGEQQRPALFMKPDHSQRHKIVYLRPG